MPQPELPSDWSQSPVASRPEGGRAKGCADTDPCWALSSNDCFFLFTACLLMKVSVTGLSSVHSQPHQGEPFLAKSVEWPPLPPCPHVLQHKLHHPTAGKHSPANGPNSARNSRHILQVFLHIYTRVYIYSLLLLSTKSLKIWPITITFEHETIHGAHCSPSEVSPFGVEENNL